MQQRFPDFIIIGAMKSGTSSIHAILGSHARVFIPGREIYFFDIDDIDQHPDFFVRTRKGWTQHDFDKDLDTYLGWYASFFEGAPEGALLGEDTSTYLSSKVAPERISKMLPEVKLIATLRDPVARAYSHYWHLVTTGRATMRFDEQLQRNPENLITRGFYKEQLDRYRRLFGPDRLRIVVFEEFVADKQRVTDSLCSFLGIEPPIDVSAVPSHRNAARPPLSLRARLLANRTFPRMAKGYSRRLPGMPAWKPGSLYDRLEPLGLRISDAWDDLVPAGKYPPMDPATRDMLRGVYRRANEGLAEMVGVDLGLYWGS